jgi:8-oxo-dGTP diphosphatase
MKKNSYVLEINGKQTTFTHKGISAMPLFKQVTSVMVVPFTKEGLIVAVRLRNRGLDIPGGHVEKHERSPEETLRREIMEEACMTIFEPQMTEIIETDYFGIKAE